MSKKSNVANSSKTKIMRIDMSVDLEVLIKDESPENIYKIARNYVNCIGDGSIKVNSAHIVRGS